MFEKDNDVVHVSTYVCSKVIEQIVHGSLKGCRSITETKMHHFKLERAKLGLEGRFLHRVMVNTDLVKTLSQIEFREVISGSHRVEHFINPRHRVFIGECDLV